MWTRLKLFRNIPLQLMSRVAESGTSAPITIWARRTLALEAEARFSHEALQARHLLQFAEIGHKKKFDE